MAAEMLMKLKSILLAVSLAFCMQIGFAQSAVSNAHAIFADDQSDRDAKNPNWNGRKIDWPVVRVRDGARRTKMMDLLKGGVIRTADDYYSASVVFQHGDAIGDFELAHSLAVIAMTLDPSIEEHRYMVAATWDRYMQHLGRPQWYGTQYARGDDGRWVISPVDPSAVTDDMRRKLAVPTLEEARAEIAKLNSH